MAIGYADKQELLYHFEHELEIANYRGESITIECMDCGCVLIEGIEDFYKNQTQINIGCEKVSQTIKDF